MPQGISGPGASGNVNGPASSTDNALTRWDGTTGTVVQDSNAILNDNGDLEINSVVNVSSAFTVKNSAGANLVRVNTEAPSAYVGSSDSLLAAAHSFAGSANTPYGVFGGLTISSGTQSVGSASIYGRTYITGSTIASANVQRGGLFITHNQSSGTVAGLIGLDNQAIQGINTQGAGLVALGYGQRTVVGFLSGSLACAYTTTYSNFIQTPNNTDGTHTITNNTGLHIEDQLPTGVTNGYGIDIEAQSAGGYAIRTNSGDIEFGDGVFIDGSEDKIQLHVQGNATQTSDILTLEQSSGTDVFTVSNTGETNIITPVNSNNAFILTDASSQDILKITTVRLDLSSSGRAFEFAVNNNNPVPGTGKNLTAMRNRIKLGDAGGGGGTQSGRVRGFDSLVTFFDDVVHTGVDGNQVRAFNASVAWASTGTATELVGINNFIAGSGGAYQAITTGLIDTMIGNVAKCGYNTGGSDAGSITDATCFLAETPKATTATHTITNSYGFRAQNLGDGGVGVTNSWALKIDDQTGGTAYAVQTGTGVHIFGDDVTIGAGAAGTDYTLTFDGETNDGVLTWLEDEAAFSFDSSVIIEGRLQGDKGADVTSADEITLGTDGNYFDITGTTTINHINKTDWQAGSVIILQFDASVTVTHNAASPTGTEASMLLSGAVDFSATADDILMLVYDGVMFREISRTII